MLFCTNSLGFPLDFLNKIWDPPIYQPGDAPHYHEDWRPLRPGAGPQSQQRQAGQWQSWGMLRVETACPAGLLLMININGFFLPCLMSMNYCYTCLIINSQ